MGVEDIQFPGLVGATDEPDEFEGYEDYYGQDRKEIFKLPDGKQWIEFKCLDEGGRSKFETRTSSDVLINRRTDDARIKLDSSSQRRELIFASVTNYHLIRTDPNTKKKSLIKVKGANVTGGEFQQWYDKADPKIIDSLNEAIRKANPFLAADVTVQMIDEEIVKLQEQRAEIVRRDAEKKDS